LAARGFKWPHQFTGPDGKTKIDPSPTDVTLVDAVSGEVRHILKGHGQWVCRLAFTPDGKTLAVGEYGGAIKLWNVAAGRLLLTIQAHTGPVTGLAFRADGRVLASCSDTGIRLWQAATDAEVARRAP
jgi:WD40 repeat protein